MPVAGRGAGPRGPALPRVITGSDEVVGLLGAIASIYQAGGAAKLVRYTFINGLPGFVTEESDGIQTTALLIEGDLIKAVYVMRNPDKLRHLQPMIH